MDQENNKATGWNQNQAKDLGPDAVPDGNQNRDGALNLRQVESVEKAKAGSSVNKKRLESIPEESVSAKYLFSISCFHLSLVVKHCIHAIHTKYIHPASDNICIQ